MNTSQSIVLRPWGIHEGRKAVVIRSETSRGWVKRAGGVWLLLKCGKDTRGCGGMAHKMRWLVAAKSVLSNHRRERYEVLLHDRVRRCSDRCGRERDIARD